MTQLMVDAAGNDGNIIMDAAGPETYTFNELVLLIRDKVGGRTRIVHVGKGMALSLSGLVGKVMKDVVLTKDELDGLMANLLISTEPPAGKTRLSGWLGQNAATVGATYASELNRHYRKSPGF